MATAVTVRADFSADELRRLATASKHANQSRRLLSIAAVLDGMSRTDAARIGGMDRQTLRDWVHRFNERGPDGLKDSWSKGNPPRLSAAQQAELARLVETGPDRAVAWGRALAAGGPASCHCRALWRGLPRAHGGQNPAPARLFSHQPPSSSSGSGRADHGGVQKNLPTALKPPFPDLRAGKPIEIWFQDEMRLGQKNGIVRQW